MTEEVVSTETAEYSPGSETTLFPDAVLTARLVPQRGGSPATPVVAILGMGYVGLPTALAARAAGARTIGIDVSGSRIKAIREQRVDLIDRDRALLASELADEGFALTQSVSRLAEADAVLICVPTPIDEHRNPDLTALRAACEDVVKHARPGQTILLTSTSYPGTTRTLLAEPLARRGFIIGETIWVASSPERIDPGNPTPHAYVPRVVGGVTDACVQRAVEILRLVTDHVVPVTSPEAAEMTKLLENSFRAVNIAFANEIADVCGALGLDAREVIDAAATKPYGFMPFYPGTGVGGHCIPCDPHYLLWELRSRRAHAPILEQAMDAITARPHAMVDLIAKELSAAGLGLSGARVLVVGVAYKPGVEDVRESPALDIVGELLQRDAQVDFFDPMVPSIRIAAHHIMLSVTEPDVIAYDAVIVNTLHPGVDYAWLGDAAIVVDPSGTSPRPIVPSALPDTDRLSVEASERMVAERRTALAVGD